MIVLRDIKLFSKVLIRSRFWIIGVKKGNRVLRYFRPYNVINHLCHNSLSKVLIKASTRSSIQISTINVHRKRESEFTADRYRYWRGSAPAEGVWSNFTGVRDQCYRPSPNAQDVDDICVVKIPLGPVW